MSALPALERIPVPAIALTDDGCSPDAVAAMTYDEIFHALPIEETLFGVARLRAEKIGDLQHLDGSTIFAKMTKSAVARNEGPVALATFDELMERLSGLAEP
jgi:hypothetical protein